MIISQNLKITMIDDDDFDFPEGVLAYSHYGELQEARKILESKGINNFDLEVKILQNVMRRVHNGEDVVQVTDEEIKRVVI